MDIKRLKQEEECLHAVMSGLYDALQGADEGSEHYRQLLIQLKLAQTVQRDQASVIFEYERDNRATPWWEVVDWGLVTQVSVGAGLLGLCLVLEASAKGIITPPKWIRSILHIGTAGLL